MLADDTAPMTQVASTSADAELHARIQSLERQVDQTLEAQVAMSAHFRGVEDRRSAELVAELRMLQQGHAEVLLQLGRLEGGDALSTETMGAREVQQKLDELAGQARQLAERARQLGVVTSASLASSRTAHSRLDEVEARLRDFA